ncbi:gp53-like domain-containing protein [Sphingomonas sp. TX0522]|uniref:gp53-like domain-containing protein n=1 Tax=Sphingomonas sp. TX0522 TaxID=2479205 RepID=UPI0018E03734|nr:hypothetical protein [Sphingomonas sp. TX0522]MBI0533254.1 hypothetical protein [Sphingomonas sp. TX0522]
MFRVDGPTAAPALPAPAAVSGTPGYFTGGDPSVPTPPTDVPVDWLNMIQEELVAIVAAAGISLSKADRGQVLAAIRALIASGGIAFASNPEAVAGAINNRALSPQSGAALVADRILGVIGGAPATLNTLGEIAASIGNDPAFATNVTAALAARVLTSRMISTGGLLTGGGNLMSDLSLAVPAASASDLNQQSDATKALTPAAFGAAGGGDGSSGWAPLPGGNMIQWGSLTVFGDGTSARAFSLSFPRPFLNVCGSIVANGDPYEVGQGQWHPMIVVFNAPTIAGATGFLDTGWGQRPYSNAHTFRWQAIGR